MKILRLLLSTGIGFAMLTWNLFGLFVDDQSSPDLKYDQSTEIGLQQTNKTSIFHFYLIVNNPAGNRQLATCNPWEKNLAKHYDRENEKMRVSTRLDIAPSTRVPHFVNEMSLDFPG